ncbi:hypothetical protein [Nocardia carnea]|uniref:hypothetical protein n=1 Tax=Nocardia carnea TaxID=37328 RepID=UPI002455E6E5|nr:hypothetical protein [Nocardia carnea]
MTVIGLIKEELLRYFDPATNPRGGGTTTVWLLAGADVSPPPWVGPGDDDVPGDCTDCGPYLWVRLVSRWRTGGPRSAAFPDQALATACSMGRAATIEVGIARCHPLDGDEPTMAEQAFIQWSDSWRIDNALCKALAAAEKEEVVTGTAIDAGEPWGPEAMVLVWMQQAHVKL